jgi:hypothetical protein
VLVVFQPQGVDQPPGKGQKMQSVEMYFNDMIAKHNLFKQAATLLIQDAASLTPNDIHQRCRALSTMRMELTENNDQLSILMEFMGPGILDTSYIGEFQRALDKSILTCNSLYAEIVAYKDTLRPCSQ